MRIGYNFKKYDNVFLLLEANAAWGAWKKLLKQSHSCCREPHGSDKNHTMMVVIVTAFCNN